MSMTRATARTSAEWLADLRSPGQTGEAALTDLRSILLTGLRRGLIGWMNTAGPEFESLAEDFVQEALLKILDKLDSFRGESQFTTWAHKVAVRVALTELRRKRWQDVSLESLLESEGGEVTPRLIADPAPGPERAVEQADMLARLQRLVMEELTEKQRKAMVAASVKGMPLEEVARRMGTNRNALYKLLHDGRVRLKQRMASEGLTPAGMLAAFEQG